MPITSSLCKGILGVGVFLTKCGVWCTQLAALLGILLAFPYLTVGIHLFQPFGNQRAVKQWFSEIAQGMYSLPDILALWPFYHEAIMDGIKMSWLGIGFLGLLMVGALPLGVLVMALVPQCQCKASHKDQA